MSTLEIPVLQKRSIDKDKKYALSRGDRWMVHGPDGRRPYNGNDEAVARSILALNPAYILTDLSNSTDSKTEAQLLIEQHVANARRVNSRYLVVNRRSGKKMYGGNDRAQAIAIATPSTSLNLLDLQGD